VWRRGPLNSGPPEDRSRRSPATHRVVESEASEVVTQLDDGLEGANEPPVVARMVVEIRSDGTTTIARGAIEDHLQGERVQVEARADSPLQLAGALAKLLFESPRMARRAIDRSRADGGARPGVRNVRRGLR